MERGIKERISGLVVLIDATTYVDTYNRSPVKCVIMITEPQTGDIQCLPRIQLSERIVQAGPQTMAEYVREEMSKRLGLPISEPLTFEEEFKESNRIFMIFTGTTCFVANTENIYSSVNAKSIPELRFLLENERISKLHYEIAKRYLE